LESGEREKAGGDSVDTSEAVRVALGVERVAVGTAQAVEAEVAKSPSAASEAVAARSDGSAHPVEDSSTAEALEEATLGLAALSTGTADAVALGATDGDATGGGEGGLSGLRHKQVYGQRFSLGVGAEAILLPPGGLLPRSAAATAASCGGTGVAYTLAALRGGGLGLAYELGYPALCVEAFQMAKRMDSLSSGWREVLWASLATEWKDALPEIRARIGEPASDLWVSGPQEGIYSERGCMEYDMRYSRHQINVALASELAYRKKVESLADAAGTASVRRARRALGRREPGPYEGVVPQAIAEHLLGFEFGADPDTVRACCCDDDGSGTHSTSLASTSDGSESNGSDAALRSGRNFPSTCMSIPLSTQEGMAGFGAAATAMPTSSPQQLARPKDEETSEEEDLEEDGSWGDDADFGDFED
jgi:hypothetical protein